VEAASRRFSLEAAFKMRLSPLQNVPLPFLGDEFSADVLKARRSKSAR
jgi:hypothetical protein